MNRAVNERFAPWQVESSLVNGQVRYSVIFRKGISSKWAARHGLTASQHQKFFEEARASGLSPVNCSVVSVNGELYYTALYRQWNSGPWELRSQIAEADYQKFVNTNLQAGRRPIYLNAYVHQGKPYLSVIFAQRPAGPFKARHGMSAEKYQAEFESAMKEGMLTRTVTSFDGAGRFHRFAAVWIK